MLALPAVAQLLPPKPKTTGGLEYFIKSNVWGQPRDLTEADFEAFLREAFRWDRKPKWVIHQGVFYGGLR